MRDIREADLDPLVAEYLPPPELLVITTRPERARIRSVVWRWEVGRCPAISTSHPFKSVSPIHGGSGFRISDRRVWNLTLSAAELKKDARRPETSDGEVDEFELELAD